MSTNIYLRRIHNFALDMNWLPWPVLPKRRWPAFKFKEKRGITLKEHQAIVARELNLERRAFYQLAWHLGASQSVGIEKDPERKLKWLSRQKAQTDRQLKADSSRAIIPDENEVEEEELA